MHALDDQELGAVSAAAVPPTPLRTADGALRRIAPEPDVEAQTTPPTQGLSTASPWPFMTTNAALLAACGGGGGGSTAPAAPGSGPTAPPATPPTEKGAARFLTQATFGVRSVDEIKALQASGYEAWLNEQFTKEPMSHLAYLESQRGRDDKPGDDPRVSDEMSYEAIWQHWLTGEDQLRARVVWALLQVFVISNIAPDIRPVAMSSYLDMLAKNAFGNYRQLLQDVTLHPAMGYYLNMLESEKENAANGTHPNENYAREVLQLFSIGLIKLAPDGSAQLDANLQQVPTFDEEVIKGFAKAFSGWSYGTLDNTAQRSFHNHDENDERLWRTPMQPWAMFHSTSSKKLLDGKVLPAGQSAERDMADALDNIFNHANVGPFIGRQLIQRLVTSNPSPGYVSRVAAAFNNNSAGVRGDMKAVIRAVLLDAEARDDNTDARPHMGKQREPVLRLATFLRGLNATSANGRNVLHYLDSADDALGQSPLLAPTVFNFYSPFYKPAGPVASAGLVAPEFQITTETTVVGSLNFFAELFNSAGYGWGDSRLTLNFAPLIALAADAAALVDRLDLMFFTRQMSAATRTRLTTLVNAINVNDKTTRVKQALLVSAMSPDFVIQK